ncbi:serine/threonine protein kinase, partial [Streptomyces sp. Wh19]|nr:serine/threonine protein kinase [Streptomyces sp. Wh19]
TSVMPPVPPRPDGPPEPDGPHPWQSQLQAARDRNEQTQVQYLDPGQDPLRRRPQRPQPQQQQPQRRQQPPPQQYQQPQQQQYPQHRQQQYQPQLQPQQQPQRQQYAPPQQPAPQPPAPRQPREPRQRSANPMRIPGLGCLKGCLFTLVLLFVAGWLIWELTPLQDWIGQGKSYWKAIGDAISTVTDWISELGGGSDSSGGNTGP